MTPDAELVRWHLEVGRNYRSVSDFLKGFSLELVRHGLAVDRVMFGSFVLHPQMGGAVYRWNKGEDVVWRSELSHAFFAAQRGKHSPLREVEATNKPYRAIPNPDHEMSDVAALAADGYTDFYALPFTIKGQFHGGVTFATHRPGGLSDEEIAVLLAQHSAFSVVLELIIREEVMRTLLRFYLGVGAGDRVYLGDVRRGEGTEIRAAIWFSDLRGFTSATESMSKAQLLPLLNGVFEILIDAVQGNGGEVLKLIGDGMMAIFEGEDGAQASVVAAKAAQKGLAALRDERRAAGLREPEVGIGLHYGEVMYGNIGGKTRLDFTVIGAAVNRTARLEGLCGKLGRRILVSDGLASRLALPLEDLGEHRVKGVPEPMRVFSVVTPL